MALVDLGVSCENRIPNASGFVRRFSTGRRTMVVSTQSVHHKFMLVMLVDDKLRDILRSHELTEIKTDDVERYEYLKQVLRRTCSRPVSSIRARDLFLTRRQNNREMASAFAYDLTRLAAQAFPACGQKYRDDIILKQFVAGLALEAVKTKLQAGGPRSLQKAVEIAKFCEQMSASRPNDDSRNNPSTVIDSGNSPSVSSTSSPSPSSQNSSTTSTPSTNSSIPRSTINIIHSRASNNQIADINNIPVKYLLDTGADFTVISEAVLAN